MTFDEYQKYALQSRDCPENAVYSVLGLTEEAGEVAGKFKKNWRDYVYINTSSNRDETHWPMMRDGLRDEVIKEMGDVLWYLACLADNIGVSLDVVANRNLEKIHKRVTTGTLHGSGDNREG